jgi:hypothetical protein
MYELRDELLSNGFAGVSCFEWGGGLLRGFLALDAHAYADELRRAHDLAKSTNGSLSIIAKSLGGVIAERALVRLRNEVEVDVFLRIAVPDARTVLRLPNVNRIVNVISPNDRLYHAGRLIAPLFLRASSEGSTTTETILLSGLSHYSMTERTRCEESTTYEMYRRILAGHKIER